MLASELAKQLIDRISSDGDWEVRATARLAADDTLIKCVFEYDMEVDTHIGRNNFFVMKLREEY